MRNKIREDRISHMQAAVLVLLMAGLMIVPASASVTAGENENPVISAILDMIGMIFDPEPVNLAGNESTPVPEETLAGNESLPEPEEKVYDLPVISEPAGAMIYLDNISLKERTPCTTLSVDGEEHTLRLELDGYETYETRVRAESGGINAELTSLKTQAAPPEEEFSQTGGVYITSRPYGATIYVDNKKTNSVTPKVLSGLKAGKHTIKLKGEGLDFVVEKQNIWIEKDSISTIFFDADLPPDDWKISIKSDDYRGCSFTADGQTPVYKMPASVEISTLRSFVTILRNGNYISERLYLTGDGSEVTIREKDKMFGEISLDSEPAGARVFVDGFKTDYRTPCILTNISEGQHIIRVSKMGYLPEEEEINLMPRSQDEVDKSISLSMEPYTHGSLEVTSDPAGAAIYIHDRPTGLKTPYTFPCI